jgi:alpha-L-fucosidase
VTTQKGDKVYVHILNWDAPLLALAPIQKTINAARLLRNGSSVEFTQNKSGVVLNVPAASKGEIDRVIVLTLASGS